MFLRATGLRFVNADDIGATLGLDAYEAAKVADAIRRELVTQRASFIFETVLSDPVGEKVSFLADAAASGYTVVLCFIGIAGPTVSSERAIAALPMVIVFDNDDLSAPYRRVAEFEHGKRPWGADAIPAWLAPLL